MYDVRAKGGRDQWKIRQSVRYNCVDSILIKTVIQAGQGGKGVKNMKTCRRHEWKPKGHTIDRTSQSRQEQRLD